MVAEIFYVAGALLLSTGAAGAALFGLSSWLGKVWASRILEKDRLRYSSELERLKNALDRSNRVLQAQVDATVFVGRVQFETEFKALADIWAKVATVRGTMSLLRPLMDIVDANEDEAMRRQRQINRYNEFVPALNQFVLALHSQSPFIPQDVYDKASEVLTVAQGESLDFQVEFNDRAQDWFRRGRENNRQLREHAEGLSDLIRARLESLTVIKPRHDDAE